MENPQPFNDTILDTVNLEGDKHYRYNEILFFKESRQLFQQSRQRSKAAASSLLYLSLLTTTLTLRATVSLLDGRCDLFCTAAQWGLQWATQQLLCREKKSWRPDLDTWCWLFTSQLQDGRAGEDKVRQWFKLLFEPKGSLLVYWVNKNA